MAAARADAAAENGKEYGSRNHISGRHGDLRTETARFLRALPLALGIRLHGRWRRARQTATRTHAQAERTRVWTRLARQHPDRRPHLADDLPDDAEDRLCRSRASAQAARRTARHAVRQLAGQAVQHGASWHGCSSSACFCAWIGRGRLAEQYTAGLIILAAAPCTAMVFVWSYLTDGDPAYTLVQVAVNDLIMLVRLRRS